MTSSTSGTRVTGYQAIRYGPDESVPTLKTAIGLVAAKPVALRGDFILTHSSGLYGNLIRFGEALRHWGKDKVFTHRSHAAIFVKA